MKQISHKDGKDAIDRHNAEAVHRPVSFAGKSEPMPNMGNDPKIAQEVIDSIPTPDDDLALPTISNWRRYDRSLWGDITHEDGSSDGKTVQIEGRMVKMNLKGPGNSWVCMDTGQYYWLGLRAYAGT